MRQLSRRTQFLKYRIFSRYCVFCYCKVIRFNGTFTNLQRFEGPHGQLTWLSLPLSLPLSFSLFASDSLGGSWFVLCGQLDRPLMWFVCLFIYLFHFVSFKANFVARFTLILMFSFDFVAVLVLFSLSSSVFFVASAAKFHFFHISNHKNYARTYTQIYTHSHAATHTCTQSIPSRTLIKCAFSRALWVAKYINIIHKQAHTHTHMELQIQIHMYLNDFPLCSAVCSQ